MSRPTWFPPGKIAPPAPPPGWLRRRLPVAAPVAVLVAGPGWGKTLALLALAQDAAEQGAATAWIALDEDDADPATFFPCLVEAVRAHVPPFGAGVLDPLAAGKLDARALWTRFFAEVAAFNLPGLFLALDEAERLGEPGAELLRGLFAAAERLPPGVRIGLASRRKPPVPLGRLVTRGLVETLDAAVLRLAPEEEAALLGEEALAQAARFEGWPLGVAALARRPGLAGGAGSGDQVAAYIAEEVVATLPPALAAFLRRAALLETPSAEACRAVFGEHEAQALLEAAESEGLAQRLADGLGFRLPAHVREHLLAELTREASAADRAAWHGAAAAWHESRGEREAAMPHLIARGDWAAAVALCQEAFPHMVVRGRHAVMARWLDAFPAEVAEREPVVAFWRGQALARAGRHAEAAAAIERAREGFVAGGDVQGELKATVKLATFALFAQDQPRFGRLIMRALALQALGRPEDRADLHLVRALAAEQRGDMALMRECNQGALEVPIGENVEVAACAAIAHLNLHTAALHRGEVAAAERHARLAESIAADWGFASYRLFAGFLLANLRLLTGETDAAGAFLRALPAGWPDLLDWHDLACAWTIVGLHHQATSDWTAAERAFERARATFERAEFAVGVEVVLERQLWLAVQRRQPARAEALLAGHAPSGSVYGLALGVPLARARLIAGDAPGALAALAPALAEALALEAWPVSARARLTEASARAALGEAAAASEALAEAERLIDAHGLEWLWRLDAPIKEAVRAPVAVPAAAAPASATRARAGPPHAPAAEPGERGAAPGPPPEPAAAAGPRLTLRAFGDFEILKAAVRLDAWPRRKAKLALAALALNPRGLATIDLAELLADGEPGAAAATTVQVSISALRRVLEPDLARGAASRYVLVREERYVLDWELVESCDVAEFARAIADGRRLADRDPAAAAAAFERAAALYRGDLLDDGFFAKYFEAEREGFRQQAVEALLWLVAHHVGRGDSTSAEDALRRAAAAAPTEEEVYRRMMVFQAARRNPERVRHAYWDYRKALKTRLGAAPEPAFEQAYQQALAQAQA